MEHKEALNVLNDSFNLIKEMYLLLNDLKDPNPCVLDHHGNCQTHGWTVGEDNRPCPQARIKQILND